ncbi:hypothetical protein ERO13_A09G176066v2 [Gossypium hirsutum]|nr:hypothetical protein ERO13_A09G176066v2 [Gossypium hirsutum]
MITLTDFYHVMTAMVPLYVAMILAYGSVKWWKIFSPGQCSGINRFVALFAVPLLSFHFIASNDPYAMNFRFIAADTLQKVMVLGILAVWSKVSKRGCLEWTITLFSLSTLPNTLVMGIPLLKGMYGEFSGSLMVQIVVLQCIIWYTLMLFMFEYRGAKMLISEQFPDTAGSIVSIHVDSDIMSLDGRQPLETEAEIKEDGKLHVTVRKSNASRSDIFSRRSQGLSSTTPRPSNLTNAEIYSLQSSRNPTPRGSSFNHTDFYSMMAGDATPISVLQMFTVCLPLEDQLPDHPIMRTMVQAWVNQGSITTHKVAQVQPIIRLLIRVCSLPMGLKLIQRSLTIRLRKRLKMVAGIFICLFGVQVLLLYPTSLVVVVAMNMEQTSRKRLEWLSPQGKRKDIEEITRSTWRERISALGTEDWNEK